MAETDRFGGIIQEEPQPKTDRFGGTIQYTPEQKREYGTYEKPFPLGRRLIDEYFRPIAKGLGMAGGAILGGAGGATAGAPSGPGAIATTSMGTVIGAGIGNEFGDQLADILQTWLGYYKPVPIQVEFQEALENVAEGMTWEMGGRSAGVVADWGLQQAGKRGIIQGIKNFFTGSPMSESGAQREAGKILAANTESGPLVVDSIEKAQYLEELIPGLKFNLAQTTGDENAVKFLKSIDTPEGTFIQLQKEQAKRNTQAIKDFIQKTKGVETTEDLLAPLGEQRNILQQAEDIARKNITAETKYHISEETPASIGKIIKNELFDLEKEARGKAKELFDKVPEQNINADKLYKKFTKIMRPSHPNEGKDKFPEILNRALENAEYTTSQAGKVKPLQSENILYHTSHEKLKGGKPNFDAYFGNKEWVDEFISKGADKEFDLFGKNIHGIKIPNDAKILDLRNKSKDAQKFMGKIAAKYGEDSSFVKSLENGEEPAISEFYEIWANSNKLGKTAKEMGYDGVKLDNEYYLTKNLIKKAETIKTTEQPENIITLEHLQGLRSEITEDLRTAVDKGKPRSLRKRLSKAIEAIDEIITGEKGGKELQKAQQWYKENVVNKFYTGETKNVLRGEEGAEALIPGKYFKPGDAGEKAAKEFLDIVGDNSDSMDVMREYMSQNLYDKVYNETTKEVSNTALNGWLKRHKLAIKTLGLQNDFKDITKAKGILDQAITNRKEFEKTVASQVLDADINDVVKQAFKGTRSKKEAAKELLNQLKGKDKAVAGLQNAMIDEILTESPIMNEAGELLSPKQIKNNLAKYDPAIKEIFRDSPEKVKAMFEVRRALEALEMGGSLQGKSSVERIEGLSNYLARRHGFTRRAISNLVSVILQPFKNFSNKQVDLILNRAFIDPDFAFGLIYATKHPEKAKGIWTNALTKAIGMSFNKRDKENR